MFCVAAGSSLEMTRVGIKVVGFRQPSRAMSAFP